MIVHLGGVLSHLLRYFHSALSAKKLNKSGIRKHLTNFRTKSKKTNKNMRKNLSKHLSNIWPCPVGKSKCKSRIWRSKFYSEFDSDVYSDVYSDCYSDSTQILFADFKNISIRCTYQKHIWEAYIKSTYGKHISKAHKQAHNRTRIDYERPL